MLLFPFSLFLRTFARKKRTLMKKILTACLALMATLAACTDGHFHVEGTIAGAADSVLRLERMGIDDVTEVASTHLSDKGDFAFSVKAPEQGPEFYRLRIGGQVVNLVIDSTETVKVEAQWPAMATNYRVSGSEECEHLRDLSLRVSALQDSIVAMGRRGGISPSMFDERVFAMVQEHKRQVADLYICKAPWSASAYFALFQTIGGNLLFNPRSNADDIRLFAAVATSWDNYHEGSPRTQNLHNIALEGMSAVRRAQPSADGQTTDVSSLIVETGSIDIDLNDNHGRLRRLHDLKGQVVMLDFHVFAQQESSARILLLQELYGKYHAKGLEIYQVSLDTDVHLWRQRTDALPWVCVRDEDGLNSRWLGTYNVQQLPEFFLLDREANLIKRSSQIADIEEEIKRLL